MKYGFVKVAAAVPAVKVADCLFNAEQTEKLIFRADEQGVEVIVFPELNLTGYPAETCSARICCWKRPRWHWCSCSIILVELRSFRL